MATPSPLFPPTTGPFPVRTQIPDAFTVWNDGSNWRADNMLGGLDATPSPTAATVINYALSNLTVGRTWKQRVVVKGDAPIASTVSIPGLAILEVQGSLKATAAITAVQTTGLDGEFHGRVDLNNLATVGVYVQHSRWRGVIRCENVPAAGIGMQLQVTVDNNGCYWNDFHYTAFPFANLSAGSIGLQFTTPKSPATFHPNLNHFIGQMSGFDTGVQIADGIDQVFTMYDSSGCNINWDIRTLGNSFQNCYGESPQTVNGFLVRTGASAIVDGGELDNQVVQGTGLIIRRTRTGLSLQGQFPQRGPILDFLVTGNGTPQIQSDGVTFYFRDGDANRDVLAIDKSSGNVRPLYNGSLGLFTSAGAPTDALFVSPFNGMMVYDSTNVKFWIRTGVNTYKGVALT